MSDSLILSIKRNLLRTLIPLHLILVLPNATLYLHRLSEQRLDLVDEVHELVLVDHSRTVVLVQLKEVLETDELLLVFATQNQAGFPNVFGTDKAFAFRVDQVEEILVGDLAVVHHIYKLEDGSLLVRDSAVRVLDGVGLNSLVIGIKGAIILIQRDVVSVVLIQNGNKPSNSIR